jgi:hypothetical protein
MEGILNLDFLKKIRRNHGLEHATITIAHSKLNQRGILGGNSTQWGFLVYGDLPTVVLSQAADEALERLRAGEKELALSPYCGTNLVVAATLTGLACALALGSERRWSNFPRVISASLVAILASKPIGSQVQKYFTTSGAVGQLKIKDIDRIGAGGLTVHRVRTSWEE